MFSTNLRIGSPVWTRFELLPICRDSRNLSDVAQVVYTKGKVDRGVYGREHRGARRGRVSNGGCSPARPSSTSPTVLRIVFSSLQDTRGGRCGECVGAVTYHATMNAKNVLGHSSLARLFGRK